MSHSKRKISHLLATYRHSTQGAMLVEFAIILPILIFLLLSGIELSRYIIILQKTERAAYTMGDIISRYSQGELNQDVLLGTAIGNAPAGQMMEPFDSHSKIRTIATSFYNDGTDVLVMWQVASGGSLSGGVSSAINGRGPGSIGPGVRDTSVAFQGDTASAMAMGGGMYDGENIISVEMFYRYEPFVNRFLGAGYRIMEPTVITRRVFFQPREGALLNLAPNFTG